MPEAVHGFAIGTTFNKRTIKQMFDDLLYPYQYPAFNSFSFTGKSTPLECGVAIASGNKTWNWTSANPSNINTNSIKIEDVTNAYTIGQNLANDGTEVLSIGASPITKLTNAATNTFRITGTNSKNELFTRNDVVTWYAPIYHGVGAAGLSVAQLQGLTKRITGEVNFNALFTTSNQKIYIAYPSAWGVLASIQDQNLFDITADFTRTTVSFTNNPGYYEGTTMSYYVYEYNNLTNLTNFRVYFNF